MLEWQAIEGTLNGKLIGEHPRRKPNPTVEVDTILADGTSCIAVWSHLKISDIAKLVTVHFIDDEQTHED